MLPKFICVGAAKSGTTSLQHILYQHPQIFLPKLKEVHFFNKPENYAKGISWYLKFFQEASESQLIGEITPDYMFAQETVERMAKDLPKDIKLIFMLRDPAKRAFSDYQFFYRRGNIDISDFKQAIADDIEIVKSGENIRYNRGISLMPITKGLYSLHIKSFLQFFPKENMLFIRFEDDFIANPLQCMSDVCKFLDVPEIRDFDSQAQNQGFHPKYRWLNKLAYDENSIFRIIFNKMVSSHTVRVKFKSMFSKLNKSSANAYQKLSQEDYIWMYQSFFKEDIENTESIIGKSLASWKPK